MAIILCLETATHNCSVALAVDGKMVATAEESQGQYIHAEKLHPFIQQVLRDAGLTLQQVQAVCVSNGPGSYTGLRIGISAAKGLCYALDVPLIALNTTEVLAACIEDIGHGDSRIVAVLDARRDEVYCQTFSGQKVALSAIEAHVVTPESFADLANYPLILVGDAAEKTARIITREAVIKQCYPSAKNMIALAEQRFATANFVDVAYHEPFYLKDFIAGKPKPML